MDFPMDLLANVSPATLEQSAQNYMSKLLRCNPDTPEHLTLSDSTKVIINVSSVGFVPLYGNGGGLIKQKILALFSPANTLNAVAFYLLDRWWKVEDIVTITDRTRNGIIRVKTLGERIVLYTLNRAIYRPKEMNPKEEFPFLCHGAEDYAKICWHDGEAVGFYSVKLTGSLCPSYVSKRYQLPVMDSIFVRKCHRGQGFGHQMLEDFVVSFPEDCLGLRYPLTKAMYKVCEKYLRQYPGDGDLLWEVESVGGPSQRSNIAKKLQGMDLSSVSRNLSFTEELCGITKVMEVESETVECRVEIIEETTMLPVPKGADEVPVTARGRSGGSITRIGDNLTEDKSENIIRIEDIEAGIQEKPDTAGAFVTELVQIESMLSVVTEEKGVCQGEETTEEPAAALISKDKDEAEDTSPPAEEEYQEEDGGAQDLNTCGSHMTVENVTQIEEKESQEDDAGVLVAPEEVPVPNNEAETLDEDEDEEPTRVEVTIEASELKLLKHSPPEGGEAKKRGRPAGKTTRTPPAETPKRRSQRQSRIQEAAVKEPTAQDARRVLRRKTVNKIDNMDEESKAPATETAEEAVRSDEAEKIPATKAGVELAEDNVEQPTGACAESPLQSVVEHGSQKLLDSPEDNPTLLKENELVTQDNAEDLDYEVEEPPVVDLKRRKLSSKRKDRIRPQQQEEKVAATEEKQEPVKEPCQVEQAPTSEQTAKEQEAAEELTAVEEVGAQIVGDKQDLPPTEVEAEDMIDDQEEEKIKGEAEMVVEEDKQDGVTVQEPDTLSAARLQNVTVVLVDLNTTSNNVSVNETEETQMNDKKMEEAAAAEEQTPNQEKCSEISLSTAAEAEMVEPEDDNHGKEKEQTTIEAENEEQVVVVETRVLRSGRRSHRESHKSTRKRKREEEDQADAHGQAEEPGQTKDGSAELQGETETVAPDTAEEIPAASGDDVVQNLPEVQEEQAQEVLEEAQGKDKEEKAEEDRGESATKGEETPIQIEITEDVAEEPPTEAEGLDAPSESVSDEQQLTPLEESTERTSSTCEEKVSNQEETPTVETRVLRSGRKSAPAAPRRKSKRRTTQLQTEEEGESTAEEEVQEKTTQEVVEKAQDKEDKTSQNEEKESIVAAVQEGAAEESQTAAASETEENAVEESSERTSSTGEEKSPEKDVSGDDVVQNLKKVATSDEKSIDEMQAESKAADEAVEEGEPEPAPAQHVADSAAQQQNEEPPPQPSDLQRVSVVLVDVKKSLEMTQEKNTSIEEPTQEKICMEMKDGPEEEVAGSPMSGGAEQDGLEDTIPPQQEVAGNAEETTKLDQSADEGDRPTAIKTRSRRLSKSARSKKEVSQPEVEAPSENSEEGSAASVRVLRRGKKAVTVTPSQATKRVEEDEGHEEPTVEAESIEEEEAQKPTADQEEEDKTPQADGAEPQALVEPTEGIQKDIQTSSVSEEEEAPDVETCKDTKVQGEEVMSLEITEEDGPPTQSRVLRRGRKSAPAAPRRKSKRARTKLAAEEEDESTPEEEVQEEQTQEVLKEAQDKEDKTGENEEKESTVAADREGAAEESQTAAASETEEQVENAVEESAESPASAGEDKVSNQEETPVVETRVLRSGRKSASAARRRKSKRRTTQLQAEDEGESTPEEEVQEEQAQEVLEEAQNKDKEEKTEEDQGESATKGEETQVQIEITEDVAEEPPTEAEGLDAPSESVSDEQPLIPLEESTERTSSTDEEKVSNQEETPTVETRVLRSGRKSAPAPRRKSKRHTTQLQTEEEGESTAEEEVQEKSTQEVLEKAQDKDQEEKTEESKEEESETTQRDENTELEDEGVADDPITETKMNDTVETPVEETSTEEVKISSEEETTAVEDPAVEIQGLRRGRRSAPAAPRRKSKRARLAAEVAEEEEEEEEEEQLESPEETADVSEKEENKAGEDVEEAVGPEQEDGCEVSVNQSQQTTHEELPKVQVEAATTTTAEDDAQDEEAPAVTSRNLRSKTRTSQRATAHQEQASTETLPQEEELQEGGQLTNCSSAVESSFTSMEATAAQAEEGPMDGDEDQGPDAAVESEAEENAESNMAAEALKLVLDADEEPQPAEVHQEDAQSLSEEKEEEVIGERVLRGRTVPSLSSMPPPEGRLSTLRSPSRRSPRKRRGPEVTPARKSKRLSRV